MTKQYAWHRPTTIPTSSDLLVEFEDTNENIVYFAKPLHELGIDTPKKWFLVCLEYRIERWRFKDINKKFAHNVKKSHKTERKVSR